MKLKVTECIRHVTERYPYTHRVEVVSGLDRWEEITDWLTDTNIPCCVINPGRAVYLNPEYTSIFIMKWS